MLKTVVLHDYRVFRLVSAHGQASGHAFSCVSVWQCGPSNIEGEPVMKISFVVENRGRLLRFCGHPFVTTPEALPLPHILGSFSLGTAFECM